MTTTLQPGATPAANQSQDLAGGLAALLQGAAVAPLSEIGWIRVSGSDRVRWLNGMVTNSIQQLGPGEGCYNFALNAQGRIQAELTAFAAANPGDSFLLLEAEHSRIPSILALLDRFIIMDDVELTDLSSERAGVVLAGPQAPAALTSLGLDVPAEPLHLADTGWNGSAVTVIHAYSPLVPRLEVWCGPETIEALTKSLAQYGARPVSAAALEALRILEGVPRYGVDIAERDLPQETNQTRALHFNKGCYLGQEIVERIRSRGQVHRTLGGFQLTGSLPQPGTPLQADSKAVGELTSVAALPLPGHAAPVQLALGIVRREALDRAEPLTYPGGTAVPVNLPWRTTTQ